MFAVCVTFKIDPAQIASFMALMIAQARASLSEEPDCSRFDVWTDPARPNEVFLYEIYKDAAAFDLHLKSEHFQQFDEDVRSMVTDKQVLTWSVPA